MCCRIIVLITILVAAAVAPATSLQLRGERQDAKAPDSSSELSFVNHPSSITEDGRNLKKGTYVDPVWFESYKLIAGKFFKRCQFQNNLAPTDGSTCPKMNIGNYSCAFDVQSCPDGSLHPKIKCDCINGVGPRVWSCKEYKPCDVTPPVTVCPKDHPLSFNPPLTCTMGMECPIGKQTCCGNTFPRYICRCKNGVFDCDDDKSCPGDCAVKDSKVITRSPPITVDEQCPNPGSIVRPVEGSQCSLPSNKTCVYDKTCWYVALIPVLTRG